MTGARAAHDHDRNDRHDHAARDPYRLVRLRRGAGVIQKGPGLHRVRLRYLHSHPLINNKRKKAIGFPDDI